MHFVLIHSPFVGALTWLPTARCLEGQGQSTRVPPLNVGSAGAPYWPYFASRVAAAVSDLPPNEPLVLAAHSAAGLLVPAASAALMGRTVRAYIFVDAALPSAGATLGDLIPPGAAVTMEALRAQANAGLLPPWGAGWPEKVWQTLIPEMTLRARFVAEVPSVPLALYEEPTPTVSNWPDAPCCYLRFSAMYTTVEEEARRSGWQTAELRGEHLHMLVEPAEVASALVNFAQAP